MQETNFYEEHPEKEGWWLNELDTLTMLHSHPIHVHALIVVFLLLLSR
jgi:hypothetical protein